MYASKPIIGLVGGIGSGKSYVADLFGELGCAIIDSDAQVRSVYSQPDIRQTLRQWWGDAVIRSDGSIDRAMVAQIVFNDSSQRRRLEALVHPLVAEARDRDMKSLAQNTGVVAFVWDTPLLLEAGLKEQCDAVVFVDAPLALRERRVGLRGWNPVELHRRENLQWPLDRKREISDDVIVNAVDAGDTRRQVRDVLSRVLARASMGPQPR